MLFEKQDDKPEKIRQHDSNHHSKFKWVTIYKGDTINLPEDHGLRLGLVPVKESETPEEKNKRLLEENEVLKKEGMLSDEPFNKTLPETEVSKKKEFGFYRKKLEKIKGIGRKTAQAIMKMFTTEKILVEALKKDSDLPIKDKLEKRLKEKFLEK